MPSAENSAPLGSIKVEGRASENVAEAHTSPDAVGALPSIQKVREALARLRSVPQTARPGMDSRDTRSVLEVVAAILLNMKERDRLIMSEGFGASALRLLLAEMGRRLALAPGSVITENLGQGLSLGNGMALAARVDASPVRVYVMLEGTQCLEGQLWEAALSAAHYRLDNLIAVVSLGHEAGDAETSIQKWRSFGWQVVQTEGDLTSVLKALQEAKENKGQPTVILCQAPPALLHPTSAGIAHG